MNRNPLSNETTPPADLINLGLKCRDCGSVHVVYTITVIDPDFPLGTYCYDCLLARCGATRRIIPGQPGERYKIPVPMPLGLFVRLKCSLGLEKPSLNPIF